MVVEYRKQFTLAVVIDISILSCQILQLFSLHRHLCGPTISSPMQWIMMVRIGAIGTLRLIDDFGVILSNFAKVVYTRATTKVL